MIRSERLLPCPFCGGEGEMSFYARTTSPDPAGFFVECVSCAAGGEGFEIQGEMPDREEYTKTLAIAAWNRRTPPNPLLDNEGLASRELSPSAGGALDGGS